MNFNIIVIPAAAMVVTLQAAAHACGFQIGDGFVIPDNNPAGASSSTHVGVIDGVMDTFLVSTYWPTTVAGGGHPWVGDLSATITFTPDAGGPSVTCDLFSRIGATSAASLGDSSDMRGFYAFTNYGVLHPGNIWADAAVAGFNAPVLGGYYVPSTREAAFQYQPLNFVQVFGLSVGPGTWTLNISDNNPGNTGRLLEWGIDYFIPAPSTGLMIVAAGISAMRRRR